jgi:hypothetical protein
MKFLALLTVWAALAGGTRAVVQEPTPKLNEEWLASDLARVEQMRAALDAPELTIEGLKSTLKSCDVREDRDIGFGSRCVYIAVYGGYTTTWVRVLGPTRVGERESRIAGLRLEQAGSPDSWALIKERLRTAWGRKMRDTEHGLACERDDAKLTLELRKRTEDALGGHVEVQVPKELAAAFELLTSPFQEVVVGKMYGEDGAPPPGRREMRQLVEARRFDLVRAVMHGLNPEGRVYAAHELLAPDRIDLKDAPAIATLIKLDVDITTAYGCDVELKKFPAALAMLD